MIKKNIKTEKLRQEANEFIKKFGYTQIAYRCQVEAEAVRKWPRMGIPEKHWFALFSLEPTLRVETLHKWNEAIRSLKAD